MSLITDTDYLIYQMRLAMLKTKDSLASRIITLPLHTDNDYILSATSHTAPDASGDIQSLGIPAPGRERALASSQSRNHITFMAGSAQGRQAAAIYAEKDRSLKSRKGPIATSGTSATQNQAVNDAAVNPGGTSAKRESVGDGAKGIRREQSLEESTAALERQTEDPSDQRPDEASHERRMATIEALKLRLQQAQQSLQLEPKSLPSLGAQSAGRSQHEEDEQPQKVSTIEEEGIQEEHAQRPTTHKMQQPGHSRAGSEQNSLQASMRDAMLELHPEEGVVITCDLSGSPVASDDVVDDNADDIDESTSTLLEDGALVVPGAEPIDVPPLDNVPEDEKVEHAKTSDPEASQEPIEVSPAQRSGPAEPAASEKKPPNSTKKSSQESRRSAGPGSVNSLRAPPPKPATPQEWFLKRDLVPIPRNSLALGGALGGSPSRMSSLRELNTSSKPLSALSALLRVQSRSDNPFAKDYAFFSGKADQSPIKLKIYMPLSDEPDIPLEVLVTRDASVEEVMGYALHEYWTEGRSPTIPEHLRNVIMWNMRIVEDDGTIDDDFPALERTRKISKFAFDQFALCEASPDQVKMNEGNRKQPASSAVVNNTSMASSSSTSSSSQPLATTTVFLKVHLYSTIEVKQTTTMPVASNIPLAEVFEQICRKRKYDPSKYVFKMADTKTDVPLDKTLDQLRVSELCILKKAGGGAGDVFLRPPDEKTDSSNDQPRFIEPDEYSSMYKQYTVSHKAFMGRHERLLTIDGDYIHLMAAENKNFFDTMKTSSHHISSVISSKITKGAAFRLLVNGTKGNDTRTYDLEAATQTEAGEICTKISFLIQMNKRESGLRLR
ncbi:stress-activated map kinase interacting protein 1-domain-containing protein [Phlyctochytrium arcticum]|nr:stress-activated map kinase interacting protein 1-domain-containing protein [Phlyctochytrium arcticum]